MKPDNASPQSHGEPELPALDWVRHASAQEELLRDVEMKLQRKRRRRLAAGSAALLAVVIGLTGAQLLRPSNHEVAAPAAAIVTTTPAPTAIISRPATRPLADGSIVELNAGAEIAVAFTKTERHVALLRGDAHFQVAKNPHRPFIVRAGTVEVRAIGTAFAVQLASSNVDVLVTEGRVQVSQEPIAPTAHAAPTLVDAGHRCVVEAGGAPRVQTVPNNVASSQLAWRIPQLEFSRTPLHEVLALVNQHAAATGGMTFEIVDSALRDIKLTGILRADNTAGLERLLETSFNVRITHARGKILLNRR